MKREKQPFSEVVRLSRLLLRAYQANDKKIDEPLEIYFGGRWRSIGTPRGWFGAEFWAAADYRDKLAVIQCELLKRLRKFYIIPDVPECFKI